MRKEVLTIISTDNSNVAAIRSLLMTVYTKESKLTFVDFGVRDFGKYFTTTIVFDFDFRGANGIVNMFEICGGIELLDSVVAVYHIEGTNQIAVIDRFGNKPSLHWVASIDDGDITLVNGADLSPVPFLEISKHMLNCISEVFYKYVNVPKDTYDDKLVVVVGMGEKVAYLGKNQKPTRDLNEAALFELNDIGYASVMAEELAKTTPSDARVGVCNYSALCQEAKVEAAFPIYVPLPAMGYWVSGPNFVKVGSEPITGKVNPNAAATALSDLAKVTGTREPNFIKAGSEPITGDVNPNAVARAKSDLSKFLGGLKKWTDAIHLGTRDLRQLPSETVISNIKFSYNSVLTGYDLDADDINPDALDIRDDILVMFDILKRRGVSLDAELTSILKHIESF